MLSSVAVAVISVCMIFAPSTKHPIPVYDCMTGWENYESFPRMQRTTLTETSMWYLGEWAMNGRSILDPDPEFNYEIAESLRGMEVVILDIETMTAGLRTRYPELTDEERDALENDLRRGYYDRFKEVLGNRTLVIQYNTHRGAGEFSDGYLFSLSLKPSRSPAQLLKTLQKRLDDRTHCHLPTFLNSGFVDFRGKEPDIVVDPEDWRTVFRGMLNMDDVDGVSIWYGANPLKDGVLNINDPGVPENYAVIREEMLIHLGFE